MPNLNYIKQHIAQDNTTGALQIAIILWAIFIIFLALVIKNKWVLAGILLYEILP